MNFFRGRQGDSSKLISDVNCTVRHSNRLISLSEIVLEIFRVLGTGLDSIRLVVKRSRTTGVCTRRWCLHRGVSRLYCRETCLDSFGNASPSWRTRTRCDDAAQENFARARTRFVQRTRLGNNNNNLTRPFDHTRLCLFDNNII